MLKKLTISFLMICNVAIAQEQSSKWKRSEVNIESGLVFSSFNYLNAKANELSLKNASQIPTSRFSATIGFKIPSVLIKSQKNLRLYTGLSFDEKNITLSYPYGTNSFRYNNYSFNLTAINFGLQADLLSFKRANSENIFPSLVLVADLGLSASTLISGYQYLEGQIIDLKNKDDFRNYYLDYNLGLGVEYSINDIFSIKPNVKFKRGWLTKIEGSNNDEYLINSNIYSLGFTIKFQKTEKKDDGVKIAALTSKIEELSQKIENIETHGKEQFIPLKTLILFPYNEHVFYDRSKDDINDALNIIKNYPAYKVLLIGYADERGEQENNLALSKKRVNYVLDYLVGFGVDVNRCSIEYRGATKKFNKEAYIFNRRVELLLIK